MSGPKVIDYEAIEQRRAEAARRRYTALRGRADALRQRCAESGHPECAVGVSTLQASSSDDIERECDGLEAAIAAGTRDLERVQFDARTREVVAGLADVLADLERREQASAAPATRHKPDTEPHPVVAADYAEKVSRRLASLIVPDTELERAAEAVLSATDRARARLLYEDLKSRIAEANKRAEELFEIRAEVAELRAQLDALPDPGPVSVLLDHVTNELAQGRSVQTQLRQARAAITAQLDAIAAQSERQFVHDAVAESLAELGYGVADVDVETPQTLVFRQSGTHGVRAVIRDGEIDVHTVRLAAGANSPASASSPADRDAEEEFCRRVPAFLTAMSRRGLSARVKQSKLPGLFTPETVRLRKKPKKVQTQTGQQDRPVTRKQNAR